MRYTDKKLVREEIIRNNMTCADIILGDGVINRMRYTDIISK